MSTTRRLAPAKWLFGLLSVTLLAGGVVGCRGSGADGSQEMQSVALEPNSFKVSWRARVNTSDYGNLQELYLRDDLLVGYTQDNVIYVLSAGGGRTQWIASDVLRPRDRLWPPVLLEALNRFGTDVQRFFAFPSNTSYHIVAEDGRRLQETLIDRGERAITSPSVGSEGLIYVGLADGRAGRAAVVDPAKQVSPVLLPRRVNGVIIGRPAVHAGTFFVGDETGRVYAIDQEGFQAWPESNPYYQTNGSIVANLTADDYGLYVPSTDSIFYVLDRQTGRQKWRYFAGTALYRSAFPTQEHIFLPVEGRGVAALSKAEGNVVARDPLWVAEDAYDVLSHDERNVYMLHEDGAIVAYAKADGRELFRSRPSGYTRFARNPTGATIFAATEGGEVVSIDPVLTRGQVGEPVPSPRRRAGGEERAAVSN